MDVKLKQRLTGAVILTSLAIIVLPVLLDGSDRERIRLQAPIPEPPQIDLEDITVHDTVQKVEQIERASEARLPQEVVDETDYDSQSDFIFDRNNLPVNWSIQLGSFENRDNADRLQDMLRDRNYRSYILHAPSNAGDVYRVFVGPSSSKAVLTEMASQIEASLKLKGQIVRYKIEEDRELLGG